MIKKQFVKSRNVVKLTFELPKETAAETVQLIADFNGWQPVAFGRLKNGKWQLVQEVEPGRAYQFRYRLLQGGAERYENDAEADDFVPNDQGTTNAVVRC
jgi:1,4-alpha-glucan branching enzyme